jgi:energy-converting hydrogenase Eha subunit A
VDLITGLFVSVMLWLALAVILISIVVAPVAVWHLARPTFPWYDWLEAIAFEVPIVALVVIVETWMFGVVPTFLATAVVLGVLEAALVALAYEFVRQMAALGPVAFAVTSGAVAGTIYVVLMQCMCLVLHGLRRWREGRHTYEALAEVLLDTLHGVEHRSEDWMDRRFKVATAAQLENASLLVERELPHRMHSADAITDAWFRKTTAEIAAAFRARKHQVFLPTSSCRGELIDFLAKQFSCVLSGDLGAMDRSEAYDKPAHWMMSVVEFTGRIAFGAAPLLVFIVINHFVKLPATLVTPMVVAGVVWIVLSVATLDPRYKEKLGTFGSIFSAFRGTG